MRVISFLAAFLAAGVAWAQPLTVGPVDARSLGRTAVTPTDIGSPSALADAIAARLPKGGGTMTGAVFFGSAGGLGGSVGPTTDSPILFKSFGADRSSNGWDNTVSIQGAAYQEVGTVTGGISSVTATFTASIASNGIMTVSATDGKPIVLGEILSCGTCAPGTINVLQLSGTTGGAGTYLTYPLNDSYASFNGQTVPSTTITGRYGILNVAFVSYGSIGVGNWVTGTGVTPMTKVSQLSTGTGGAGTYYVTAPYATSTNSQGAVASVNPETLSIGGSRGQTSVRFLNADGLESGAIFQYPVLGNSIQFGLGSIQLGDYQGSGFALNVGYFNDAAGPLPLGCVFNPFQVLPNGSVQMHSTDCTGQGKNITNFEFVPYGPNAGNIGIGATSAAWVTPLLPLFPLHVQSGKQIVADSGSTGAATIYMLNNGTAILGTNQSAIAFLTGSNTPGSATQQAAVIAGGMRLGSSAISPTVVSDNSVATNGLMLNSGGSSNLGPGLLIANQSNCSGTGGCNYALLRPAGSGGPVTLTPLGVDYGTAISWVIGSAGGGIIRFQTNGQDGLVINNGGSSAVNYIRVTGAATGTPAQIEAQGDATADLRLVPHGSGMLDIYGTAATTAVTPSSFSANRRVQIKINGTSYWIPATTASW